MGSKKGELGCDNVVELDSVDEPTLTIQTNMRYYRHVVVTKEMYPLFVFEV